MTYSIGHIYKIICNIDSNIVYIGSTFNQLRHRWQGHKYNYKSNYGKFSIHKYFDKYGINNFKIILIKSYNVVRENQKDCKHLHAYETLWISKTKNCINKILPFSPMRYLNDKKYIKNYRENHKEQAKKYRENHKEEIKKVNKIYYQTNKDKFKEYQKNNKKNKQEILEYQKNYREKNSEKQNEKINCECGGKYTFINKSTHFKTKKHQKYLET